MPRRKKNTQPEPSFTFVEPHVAVPGSTGTKLRTRASRSHAAYWGGRRQRPDQPQHMATAKSVNGITHVREIHTTEISFIDVYELERMPPTSHSKCYKPRPAGEDLLVITSTSPDISTSTPPTVRHLTADRDASTEQASELSKSHNLMVSSIHQRLEIERFAISDPDYSSAIPSVCCTLLQTAQLTALTGRGKTAELLGLKAQVIRSISTELCQRERTLSLQCIGGIMSLGSPIVSLISQDLPQGLSIEEYVEASMRDKATCNKDFALVAKRASHESGVHWMQLRDLISKSRNRKPLLGQFDLMGYIFRYMQMYAWSSKLSSCLKTDSN